MEAVFTVSLPREKESVPMVRHVCRCALEDLGVEQGCIDEIELVVTEAATNVLKHADVREESYQVAVTIEGRSLTITVKDAGGGFNPAAVSFDGAEPYAEAGRGLQLMSVLVDKLEFVYDGGTTVHLTKELRLKEDAVLAELTKRRTAKQTPIIG